MRGSMMPDVGVACDSRLMKIGGQQLGHAIEIDQAAQIRRQHAKTQAPAQLLGPALPLQQDGDRAGVSIVSLAAGLNMVI